MPIPSLNAIQLALSKSGMGWLARDTAVSKLSEAQRKHMLGAVPSQAVIAQMAAPRVTGVHSPAISYDPRVDWRQRQGGNHISAVRNQGGCGSCVSFACVALVESMSHIERAAWEDLSEADSHFNSSHGATCDGWWPDQCLDQMRTRGVVDETAFPYASAFPNGDIWQGPPHGRATPNRHFSQTSIRSRVQLSTPAAAKHHLTNVGPVAACMDVYGDFFNYSSGVYKHVTGDLEGGHCVLVVGYDDADKCWIIKNSWDTTWGMGGYAYVSYEALVFNGSFYPMYGATGTVLPCFREFIRQTGTPLASGEDTNGDFTVARIAGNSYSDLVFIKRRNTGTGTIEVHALSGASNYQSFLVQTGTPLTQGEDANGDFFMADVNGDGKPDLVFVKRRNTGSGQIEVHVLSGASNYQNFILQTPTALSSAEDANGSFYLADVTGDGKADLVFIKRKNTGTGSIEVHTLTATSNFATFAHHTGTPLALGEDGNGDFLLADIDRSGKADLVFIKRRNTGTKTIEVHVLSESSGFQQFFLQTGSALAQGEDANGSFALGDVIADGWTDLVFIKRRNTGTGRIELHALRG